MAVVLWLIVFSGELQIFVGFWYIYIYWLARNEGLNSVKLFVSLCYRMSESSFSGSAHASFTIKKGTSEEWCTTFFRSARWINSTNLSMNVVLKNTGTTSSFTTPMVARVRNLPIESWMVIVPDYFNLCQTHLGFTACRAHGYYPAMKVQCIGFYKIFPTVSKNATSNARHRLIIRCTSNGGLISLRY